MGIPAAPAPRLSTSTLRGKKTYNSHNRQVRIVSEPSAPHCRSAPFSTSAGRKDASCLPWGRRQPPAQDKEAPFRFSWTRHHEGPFPPLHLVLTPASGGPLPLLLPAKPAVCGACPSGRTHACARRPHGTRATHVLVGPTRPFDVPRQLTPTPRPLLPASSFLWEPGEGQEREAQPSAAQGGQRWRSF